MSYAGGKSTKQRPAEERFWEKVDAADCWEYRGAIKDNGYGNFCPHRSRTMLAHRFAWETLVGPIPEGMTLDHMCLNRRCVNPDHLRVMSARENTLAGHSEAALNARKTRCANGHELAGKNLRIRADGSRACRLCCRRWNREAKARRKAEVTA